MGKRHNIKLEAIILCNNDGTFTCAECMTNEEAESLGDPEVDFFEEYSDGWLAPIVCHRCKLSLPVYITGGPA